MTLLCLCGYAHEQPVPWICARCGAWLCQCPAGIWPWTIAEALCQEQPAPGLAPPREETPDTQPPRQAGRPRRAAPVAS